MNLPKIYEKREWKKKNRRIYEFVSGIHTHKNGYKLGGLISITDTDETLVVNLYRVDKKVEIFVSHEKED